MRLPETGDTLTSTITSPRLPRRQHNPETNVRFAISAVQRKMKSGRSSTKYCSRYCVLLMAFRIRKEGSTMRSSAVFHIGVVGLLTLASVSAYGQADTSV